MWALVADRTGAATSSSTASAAFLFDFGSRGPERVGGPIADLGDPPGARARGDRPDAAGAGSGRSCRTSSRCAPVNARRPPRSCSTWSAGDAEAQGQLAAAIGCSTAWLPGRERTKTNCIRLIHEMRMSMREIGRRMVERGAFDEIEDFGFVRAAEIDVLLDGDASTLRR